MDEVYISTRAGVIAADCYEQRGQFATTYDRKHGYYAITHLPTGLALYQSLEYDKEIFALRLEYLADLPLFDLQSFDATVREEIRQRLMLRPKLKAVGT